MPVDHRSDIFSFGIVLYEMLSRQRPFKGETSAETMTAILKQDPPELAGIDGLSPVLDRVVRRCLEKSPDDRFHSAHDLGLALEAVAGQTGAEPKVKVAVSSQPFRRGRDHSLRSCVDRRHCFPLREARRIRPPSYLPPAHFPSRNDIHRSVRAGWSFGHLRRQVGRRPAPPAVRSAPRRDGGSLAWPARRHRPVRGGTGRAGGAGRRGHARSSPVRRRRAAQGPQRRRLRGLVGKRREIGRRSGSGRASMDRVPDRQDRLRNDRGRGR